jgi:hypothetical protein
MVVNLKIFGSKCRADLVGACFMDDIELLKLIRFDEKLEITLEDCA